MKKIILIAIATLITTGTYAQTSKEAKPAAKYFCPKCDNSTFKGGKCSHDQTALVKEGKYYCPMHTNVTSNKQGNCPKCGMALVKMEAETVEKYACSKCDWTISPVKGQCPHSTQSVMKDGELKCVYCHDSAGKCTKCDAAMEKVEIRKKKESKKG